MLLATLEDVADRLGRDLTADEARQGTALLQDATTMILDRFPQLATAPSEAARAVCRSMVVRVLRNPDGVRSEQIDDYQRTIDSARSTGELYISDSEADLLRPPNSTAFSIVVGV